MTASPRIILRSSLGTIAESVENVVRLITSFNHFSFSVPPIIEDDGDVDLTVIQDRSIRLPCEVQGDPRPQITWTKNGVRIAESDPHYFISEEGSLEIFSADPQDTATYSCTAINVAGVKEKRITLFVQGRELIFFFKSVNF